MATPKTANDIFTTSWKASPPPPPLAPSKPALHAGLGRSKTTGSQWRAKSRAALDPYLYEPPSFEDSTPRADPLPLLVIPTDAAPDTDAHHRLTPRTVSFFESPPRYKASTPGTASPSHSYDRPVSPAFSTSTAASTHSSNPSLSATLPFPASESGSLSGTAANDPTSDVELRFFPTNDLRLGTGRYSRVYLAGYRRGKTAVATQPSTTLDEEAWRLCAVKKLDEDDESQRLGLREAWFLRQLASSASSPDPKSQPTEEHPGKARVVRLLGMKREDEVATGAAVNHKPRISWPHSSTLLHQALEGPKSLIRHSRHISIESTVPPFSISPPSTMPFPGLQPQPDQHLLLVLPFAPGVLSDVIHTKPHLLTPQRHTRIGLQLAQAISYIHSQGILHTDIKPQNVLLTSGLDVLLSDFNTAIHLPSASMKGLPDDAAGLGTPVYSPPEFNRPPPSPFSFPVDIWAMGVSLMVAIVRREPYVRLMNGKGRKGNGRHELKMWLGKGAYWQWEEQERMDPPEEVQIPRSARRLLTEEEDEDEGHVGLEQLRKVLDVTDPDPKLVELEGATPSPGQDVNASLHDELGVRYDDDTPALHYPAGPRGPSTRVPQRIFSLLRNMCSTSPSARPHIDEVVATFQEELGPVV